jgi:hypothetical protein
MTSDKRYLKTYFRVTKTRFDDLNRAYTKKASLDNELKNNMNGKGAESVASKLMVLIGADAMFAGKGNDVTLSRQVLRIGRSYAKIGEIVREFKIPQGIVQPKIGDQASENEIHILNYAFGVLGSSRKSMLDGFSAGSDIFHNLATGLEAQFKCLNEKRYADYFIGVEEEAKLLGDLKALGASADEFSTLLKGFEQDIKKYEAAKKAGKGWKDKLLKSVKRDEMDLKFKDIFGIMALISGVFLESRGRSQGGDGLFMGVAAFALFSGAGWLALAVSGVSANVILAKREGMVQEVETYTLPKLMGRVDLTD